jgi:hypothetical protein
MKTAFVAFVLCALPAAAQVCPGDVDGSGDVTVDEIVRAVNSGLNGCEPESDEAKLAVLAGTTWRLRLGTNRDVVSFRFEDAVKFSSGGDALLEGVNLNSRAQVFAQAGDGTGGFLIVDTSGGRCYAHTLWLVDGKLLGTMVVFGSGCASPTSTTVYAIAGEPN